jgi:hypothetical protein
MAEAQTTREARAGRARRRRPQLDIDLADLDGCRRALVDVARALGAKAITGRSAQTLTTLVNASIRQHELAAAAQREAQEREQEAAQSAPLVNLTLVAPAPQTRVNTGPAASSEFDA